MTDSYIEGLERDIRRRERELKKLRPQVAPLQEIVSARYDDMEVASDFANSCECDFSRAVADRDRVKGQIEAKERHLKQDNDLLNSALRHRREEEKRAERRAKRKAKAEAKEEPRFYDNM